MEPHKVHFDFSNTVPAMGTPRTDHSLSGSMRIPVQVSASISPNDTLEHVEDPFEDVGHQMDHEVERVLREWDTNTHRVTHNTFRLRPTPSASTPNSPFNSRKKQFSNSTSNLSASGDFGSRRNFDFPEVKISRREGSRLDASVESLTEEIKSPLYTTCPKTGVKLLKMEFDTEGYGPDNITVKVAEQKLVIHAQQNEIMGGRTSTTEFCRKIKLPIDVNPKMLQCYFNPENNTLIAEVPVISKSPTSVSSSFSGGISNNVGYPHLNSSTSGGIPNSPFRPNKTSSISGGIPPSPIPPHVTSSISSAPPLSPIPPHLTARQELLNIPFVRQETFGKTMHLNVEIGRVFRPDDVTVKVKGQDKVIVSADRVENTDSSKLNASIYREFDLSDKILAKTLKAGLSGEGILRVYAILDDPITQFKNGNINVEIEQQSNGLDKSNQENRIQDLKSK